MQEETLRQASEREVVVTRTVNGPARIVFDALPIPNCSAVVAADVYGHGAAFLRDGCAGRGHLPSRVRTRRDGVLRHLPRSDAALAPRVDR